MTHTARDGWKLVPVEPTAEMLKAADPYALIAAIYRTMLAAAPSPPSEVTREEIARVIFIYTREEHNGCLDAADAVLSLFHQSGEKG